MTDSYDPQAVEQAAQHYWARTHAFEVSEDASKPKFYCLSMLPYPSGALHVGHVRNYTIGDVISRFQRMQGKNVLQPVGWDAFGLPAENAAIKHQTAPAKWTRSNIAHMREQLKRMGFAYDWSREFATCDVDYYVHEQRMFTRLFKQGMAYRRNAVVNWDPVDQTVLANEQVVDGRGWRTGAQVEKREIPQWFLKITDYAQELLDGLDDLEGWPDSVKTMQRNWLGRSEGIEVRFDVAGSDDSLTVFTTRPDTLMGVTFVTVAPEHPLARKAAAGSERVAKFVAECAQGGTSQADLETQVKRGVDSGLKAIHPVSGEEIPVWIGNFVLMGYGTGAVMAVPGHDQRDHAFAREYGLPIRMVIVDGGVMDALRELKHDLAQGVGVDPMRNALQGGSTDAYGRRAALQVVEDFEQHIQNDGPYCEHGTLVNSGPFDGLDFDAAFKAVGQRLEGEGRATRKVNWRLRDWGVSRQRYWGCPIPIIHCADCGAQAVPEADLPVRLPEDVAFSGYQSPLKSDPEWRKTRCPECGGAAERETDTFDTFMESSWYYARYCCPGADTQVDERANYWLPVDQYIGGIEHAILHLLYFRFYHKLLRDAGMLASDEPATDLLCQGMVLADTYYREGEDGEREWINPADVALQRDDGGRVTGATLKADGNEVNIGSIEKMSKSKNNGVDPQLLVDQYGADTVRLFSMFAAPPDQSLEWSEAGVEGMSRFVNRLWRAVEEHAVQARADAEGTREILPPAGGDAEGTRDIRPPTGGDAEGRGGDTSSPPSFMDPAKLTPAGKELRRQLHETIAKVGDDYDRRHAFNTAIAAIMELFKHVSHFKVDSDDSRALLQQALEAMVLMLNPITPHLSHALWQKLGHAETLLEDQPWPEVDQQALVRDSVTLAAQVNGKLRATIELSADASREQAEEAARAEPTVQRAIDGKTVRKVIVIPGKIVNIVAN